MAVCKDRASENYKVRHIVLLSAHQVSVMRAVLCRSLPHPLPVGSGTFLCP